MVFKLFAKFQGSHGVGGQAKLIGMAAIPLGLAGSSSVLEVAAKFESHD